MADLVISGITIPPAAMRGITQTLEPIDATVQVARTVNGNLLDISAPQFRKYRSTVNCADQQVPAFDGVWPGMTVTVDCIVELSYPTGGVPARPVVEETRVENGLTFYRPRLTMLLLGYNVEKDEWGAVISWSIQLEER